MGNEHGQNRVAGETFVTKGPTDAELEAHMDKMAAEMQVDSEAAAKLMEADPKLPYISAFVIARDQRSDRRSRDWVTSGEMDFDKALNYIGSFGRLDFMLWGEAEGHTTRAHLTDILPEMWRGSDPDDTDPRFLTLWRDAYAANEGVIILDDPERPLPPGKYLTVYRGQDSDATMGISWTLDRDIAQRFADGAATRQGNRHGEVFVRDMPRRLAMAYLTGRGEQEVIIDPMTLPPPQLLISGGAHRAAR